MDEEDRKRKEEESSNSIRVNDKDMVAHPSKGGCFEQSVKANVEALHGHHGPKWHHIFVTHSLPRHLFASLFLICIHEKARNDSTE